MENKEKTVAELLREHLEQAIDAEAEKSQSNNGQRFFRNEKGELVEDITKHYPGYDAVVFEDLER